MSVADLEGGNGGQEAPPSFLFFPRKNIADKEKIHKRNINKIYQVEPTLKEMTCLMTIAETKKTFSTFQFFHKNYWNNGSGKLIAAIRSSKLNKTIPRVSPKLLNLNQEHPSKKWFFWSKHYKIEVMVTYLIETLELPNFGHMSTSTI